MGDKTSALFVPTWRRKRIEPGPCRHRGRFVRKRQRWPVVQTAVWTKDPNEGSPINEEISFSGAIPFFPPSVN